MDIIGSSVEDEIENRYPFMSFIEINDEGYEQRLICFYKDSASDIEEQRIGFTDGQRQYLGTTLSEVPWRNETYSKLDFSHFQKRNPLR
ncbi:hypothetical protein [uncultured Microscilla sp.]|uniref:hypothetical protein n=1 Tax=uncultured Microscilla sp. TaxID=432653 RepID=UPI002635307C|nr:hypothetical protein [uncultured Microscilla sp.]